MGSFASLTAGLIVRGVDRKEAKRRAKEIEKKEREKIETEEEEPPYLSLFER